MSNREGRITVSSRDEGQHLPHTKGRKNLNWYIKETGNVTLVDIDTMDVILRNLL